MLMTQLVGKLGRSDAKLIGRDRFLIFMFAFALIIATVLRFGLPGLDDYLANRGIMPGGVVPIRLADVFPMLVAYMGLYTGALLVGTMFGFMLLDERDHNTIKAMLVTPVPLQQYLLYRVGGTAVLAFITILGMVFMINQALLPIWQMVLIATGAALTAPIVMLFFATFATNKVQGFAFSKFAGISGWTIMIGFFVAEPWQWLIGLYPPFWISKAYWLALDGRTGWWLALMVGIVLQLGMIGWFMGRFNKVAYR